MTAARSSHNAKKKRYISLSGNLQIPDVCIQFELIYFVFYSIKSSSHTEKKSATCIQNN